MSRTMLIAHVALCVLGLGFAWQRAHAVAEKQGGPSSVTLLDVEPAALVEVRYEAGDVKTVLKPQPIGDTVTATATLERGVGESATTATIPGGKPVETALLALTPLKTKRTLGVVEGDALAAMGLQTPKGSLAVTTKKQSLTLDVGDKAYGGQGVYVRVAGDPTVHLIDNAILTGVEGDVASLLEKRPVPADLEDITGVTVSRGQDQVALVHVDREQVSTRFVARADSPQTRDDVGGKVLTSLRNLRGTALAPPEALEGATPVLQVAVTMHGAPPTRLTLLERADGKGHLARVDAFTWELTPTSAKELLEDAGALFP